MGLAGWPAVAAHVWDDESCYAVATEQVQSSARPVRSHQLPIHVTRWLGSGMAWTGDLRRAAALIAETTEWIAAATGTRFLPYAALMLAGSGGRETEAAELIETVIGEARAAGQGMAASARAPGGRHPVQRARPLRDGDGPRPSTPPRRT